MRIMVFSELLYPQGGGAELATWLYVKMLAEEGYDLFIVTTKQPNEHAFEIIHGRIRTYELPIRVLFGTRYYTLANIGILISNFITKLIKKCDVVYIPGTWYSVIPVAKFHKKPVIVHLHNYSIACPTSLMYDFAKQFVNSCSLKSFMLHERIEKKRNLLSTMASCFMNEMLGKYYNRLGELADALIFVSSAQMRLILSKIPTLRYKSYLIYNPIPDLPFIKTKERGVSYFGGKSFVKGFYVLMQALKTLKIKNIEVYLTKTSENPKKLKISDGVSINLLPRVDNKVLHEVIMSKTSVVVIPSLYPEPSPYTLIESMLHGKLIIASNIGGIPEIVGNHLIGVKLIEPGDYVALANTLDHFLSLNLEEVNEIGIKNREYMLRKIDNEKILKDFIRVLHRVLN